MALRGVEIIKSAVFSSDEFDTPGYTRFYSELTLINT